MEKETKPEQAEIVIEAKTLSQLAKDMKVSVGTARLYMAKIGMEEPVNGGYIYSPREVKTALIQLGYI